MLNQTLPSQHTKLDKEGRHWYPFGKINYYYTVEYSGNEWDK